MNKDMEICEKVVEAILKSKDIRKQYIPPRNGFVDVDIYTINEELKLEHGNGIHVIYRGNKIAYFTNHPDYKKNDGAEKIFKALEKQKEINKAYAVDAFLNN